MSKIIPLYRTADIEEEACAWIAKFDSDGSPSQRDLAEFREWVNRSPQHQEQIKYCSELFGDLNILTELAVPLEKPKQSWFRKTAAYASFVVATIAVFAVLVVYQPQWTDFENNAFWANDAVDAPLLYSTAIGEQKSLMLVDGSSIHLNTASQIEVDYDRGSRRVRLLRGEAYFDVAHEPERPFLVFAGSNIVRAVGTAFTVQVMQENIEVVVADGTVELAVVPEANASAEPAEVTKLATLKAGQSATFKQEIETIQPILLEEINRKLSWRDGMLAFSDEPLQQVVDEVSRYTEINIVISDPSISQLLVGGYFKAGDTQAMLEALESSLGIKISQVNDKLVLLSANTK